MNDEHQVNEHPELEAPQAPQAPEPQAPELHAQEHQEPQVQEQQAQEQPQVQEAQATDAQAPDAQAPEAQAAAKAASDERRKAAQANWQRLVDAKSNGATVEGVVKTPVKGGLLVDISGYRGFLPASQTGVAKGTPLETLVKSTVPLKVLDVDEGRKRVVVSHRRAVQEQRRGERADLIRSLKVGEERESTVVRLTDFG
ncbi:MAG TPA: S1 RNA-binding domain-containing protein, partial [Candidatus Baltobacteraceae bacterium]|nr:S1 RNA-binding domain-containing protein [Candidatus Baltobacteraceae bacterium]